MPVGFTEAQPPASDDAIAAVERELSVSLPDDYKEFLKRHNGGYLDENLMPGTDGSVRYLYSAGPNDDEDIDDLAGAERQWSAELPPGVLAIGEDEGTNLIVMAVDGDDRGAVSIRFHDVLEGQDPYERLADSFGEFFEALQPDA